MSEPMSEQMSDAELAKMETARFLLDPPAPEVVGKLIAEVRRLRQANELWKASRKSAVDMSLLSGTSGHDADSLLPHLDRANKRIEQIGVEAGKRQMRIAVLEKENDKLRAQVDTLTRVGEAVSAERNSLHEGEGECDKT